MNTATVIKRVLKDMDVAPSNRMTYKEVVSLIDRMSDKSINNWAFKARTEDIMMDLLLNAKADRYETDPLKKDSFQSDVLTSICLSLRKEV